MRLDRRRLPSPSDVDGDADGGDGGDGDVDGDADGDLDGDDSLRVRPGAGTRLGGFIGRARTIDRARRA
jgi:hypothetical protein